MSLYKIQKGATSCGAWCCYYYLWEEKKKTYDPATAEAVVEGAFWTGLQFDISQPILKMMRFCDPRKIKTALSANVTACYLCTKTTNLITASKESNLGYVHKLLGDLKKGVWNSDGMDILKSNLASYAIGIYEQHGKIVTPQTIGKLTNQTPLHYALTKHDGTGFQVLDPNVGDWKNTGAKDLLTTTKVAVGMGSNYYLQYTGLSILINN